MGIWEYSLAVIGLLLTPGPINTLLALAGANAGFWRAIRLVVAEMLGYLLVVIPLCLVGTNLIEAWPFAGSAIKFLAALWVLYLAVKLWRMPAPDHHQGRIDFGAVFVTTLLNPKGLIFGLVLLPGLGNIHAALLLFVGLILVVASLWAAFGAGLGKFSDGRLGRFWLRRLAACWMGGISSLLVFNALGPVV